MKMEFSDHVAMSAIRSALKVSNNEEALDSFGALQSKVEELEGENRNLRNSVQELSIYKQEKKEDGTDSGNQAS